MYFANSFPYLTIYQIFCVLQQTNVCLLKKRIYLCLHRRQGGKPINKWINVKVHLPHQLGLIRAEHTRFRLNSLPPDDYKLRLRIARMSMPKRQPRAINRAKGQPLPPRRSSRSDGFSTSTSRRTPQRRSDSSYNQ